MKEVICQYCNEPAEWVDNSVIYGRRFGKSYMAYYCQKDDAYVGCHNNTRKPKGTLANKELREWRIKAHAVVDPIWQSKEHSRRNVYAQLPAT